MKKIRRSTAFLVLAFSLTTLHAEENAGTEDSRFQRLDTNGDGFLSKDEWMAIKSSRKDPKRANKRFARMDQNSDGQITQEEFLAPKNDKAGSPEQGSANE
jgi:hypothetical protein